MAETLFDKIWRRHSVADLGEGFHLIFVDRHMMNDISAGGFVALNRRGLSLAHPELTFATPDHTIATLGNADRDPSAADNRYVAGLRESAAKHCFRLFEVGGTAHGIVHVVAAEQGLALPGLTLTCGDSHTCTLGAMGALAWGIGQSEVTHVLATQTSVQRKPKTMRLNVEGRPAPAVRAKDVILHLIGCFGTAGAAGYAVEFAGSTIRDFSMEERFTVCNMAVEMGARFGLIAPDSVTFSWLEGRPFAPRGDGWRAALGDWSNMVSDEGAAFDAERTLDVSRIEPQITWGTSPEHVIGIGATIPFPAEGKSEASRAAHQAALDYAGLTAGAPIKGTPIDMVFIGSCTNGRLSDLRAAAAVVRGRKVARGVKAWVVPGSEAVRRAAEAEGLHRLFSDAGFGWGKPGCSMCGGSGDRMREIAEPGHRVVSTTNRNFVGRQGPGSRTHLASPETAAASAVAGYIADVREMETSGG